jgi:crotonobetainyl-CoA:carnitine CoA-transferase CaiB-like acyl-CoA transferase
MPRPDGYLSVLIYNDKHWQAFFDVIGRPELRSSPMFGSHTARAANIGAVYAFVAEVMATRGSDEWMAALEASDIPVARLHSTESLLSDPHLRAVDFFPEFDHPSEGRIRTLAPVGRYSATLLPFVAWRRASASRAWSCCAKRAMAKKTSNACSNAASRCSRRHPRTTTNELLPQ